MVKEAKLFLRSTNYYIENEINKKNDIQKKDLKRKSIHHDGTNYGKHGEDGLSSIRG